MKVSCVLRASARVEHLGCVSLAASEVFEFHWLVWFASVLAFVAGALALYRDCRLWAEDEDAGRKEAALA